MFALLLNGPLKGQTINIATSNGNAGVADGWAKDLAGVAYPFDSSGVKPNGTALPASYTAWANAGYPAGPAMGALPVVGAIVSLSNASPAVLTLSAGDYAKFANGDSVTITGTGKTAADGKTFPLASGNATNHTFALTGLDLSGEAGPVTQGTVTKV